MTAHRIAFLSCDGKGPDGAPCDAMTLDELYVPGSTPRTAVQAREHPHARGWHTRPNGRDLCPDCWKEGQR